MVRSLIDTQRHLGWLPDCRMSLCKGLSSLWGGLPYPYLKQHS